MSDRQREGMKILAVTFLAMAWFVAAALWPS